MKVTRITDLSALTTRITAWGKAASKWTAEGHTLAVSALAALQAHGDIGPVNRLYLAMPKGTKSSAMASWLLTYGALLANTDKATKKDKPFVYTKDKSTNVDAGEADPWFDHKPEPDADKVFDVQAAVKAILAKAKKAPNVEHREMLSKLAEMVGEEAPATTTGTEPEGLL